MTAARRTPRPVSPSPPRYAFFRPSHPTPARNLAFARRSSGKATPSLMMRVLRGARALDGQSSALRRRAPLTRLFAFTSNARLCSGGSTRSPSTGSDWGSGTSWSGATIPCRHSRPPAPEGPAAARFGTTCLRAGGAGAHRRRLRGKDLRRDRLRGPVELGAPRATPGQRGARGGSGWGRSSG